MLARTRRRGNPCKTIAGNVNQYRLDGKQRGVPQKPKNRAIIWSGNPTAGCTQKGNENSVWRRYPHCHVHCSLFTHSWDAGRTWVSINKREDKENVVYVYNEYYSVYKGVLFRHTYTPAVCDTTDESEAHATEINHSTILYDSASTCNLKKSNS